MSTSTFIGLLLLGALCWYFYSKFTSESVPMFCTSCGHEGQPKAVTRGSILIEIVLWLCFIVPGLIYSLWRLNNKGKVCEKCGHDSLIPPDSPTAQAQKRSLGITKD